MRSSRYAPCCSALKEAQFLIDVKTGKINKEVAYAALVERLRQFSASPKASQEAAYSFVSTHMLNFYQRQFQD